MARTIRPLILVRGFGGPDVSDELRNAYQGFNDGTVYPGRRGENYIYEGFVLRALKSEQYPYRDATNVVGYYASPVTALTESAEWDDELTSGTVVIDPATAARMLANGVTGTLWIYRFYDLQPRAITRYGEGLARLIRIVNSSAAAVGEPFDGVDVVAHSMGGLVVRAALRYMKDQPGGRPDQLVHRVVTLGTPHRGISFQRLPRWLVEAAPRVQAAADELAAFDPDGTEFLRVRDWFPVERILTVVGTDYRSYGTTIASIANRLSSLIDEGSLAYNRSDGLVKQAAAQLPGAPRAFVHKCHSGPDSLITSREAYEIAMRFFHGTHRVRLWLDDARVLRGKDRFGRSEFYLGVSIKPRYVDFELFRQTPEAENCYGPFHSDRLTDGPMALDQALSEPLSKAGDQTTGWAGPDRMIWEGWVDATAKPAGLVDPSLVFRLDIYIGERDSFGVGFSDNVVFRKQYYIQAIPGDPISLYVHTGERYLGRGGMSTREELESIAGNQADSEVQRARPASGHPGLAFDIVGTGFTATLRVAVTPEPSGPSA